MPRTARASLGGWTYHVLNRGNARAQVFHKPEDFDAFLEMMAEATVHVSHSWCTEWRTRCATL
jgi:putative transposase